MKKLDAILLKVFLYELPIFIGYVVFACFYDLDTSVQAGGYIAVLYNFGGYIFGSWMILSVYLCIRLIVSGLFREQVLAKITFIKERDEREVILSGKAAKTTMLTSLAILMFLFCLSCFQFTVYHVPPEKAVEGKTKIVSLSIGFFLLDRAQQEGTGGVMQGDSLLSYTGLPISSSTVILGLMIWQIIAYNYTMKRLMK